MLATCQLWRLEILAEQNVKTHQIIDSVTRGKLNECVSAVSRNLSFFIVHASLEQKSSIYTVAGYSLMTEMAFLT